jgi:hypothetical protein
MQIIDTIEKDDPSYCSVNSETNNVYFVKRGNIFHTYTISGYILINFESLKKKIDEIPKDQSWNKGKKVQKKTPTTPELEKRVNPNLMELPFKTIPKTTKKNTKP